MTVWLELDHVREICFKLIVSYELDGREPVPSFATRYPGKLEACLAAPQQTFDEQPLYPTLVDQAAILFYLMNKDHPFLNGNKRLALVSLLVFLFFNDKWLDVPLDDLYQFSVSVAASDARLTEINLQGVKEFIGLNLIDAERTKKR
jgi:death on curing protein